MRRFAGVVRLPRPNRGWARIALYCVDEEADARCATGVVENAKLFGLRHNSKSDHILNISVETLGGNLDLLSIVKEFGPPDRSYRMAGALHHVYEKLVLQTLYDPAD